MSEEDIKDLDYGILKIPRLIPPELIEAVKFKAFTPERFYTYQEEHVNNPYNFLLALYDKTKKIKGYLWAVIDESDGALFINTFSICKEYWGKGKAMEKAIDIIKGLANELSPPSVRWITTNDKFFLKHGFKRSREVIMEYVFPSNAPKEHKSHEKIDGPPFVLA